ncbi:MAG: hypothetical protein EGR16_07285 [Clostridiales bacterium]|nr:hypothetical protein [Clostridiales bacterium]
MKHYVIIGNGTAAVGCIEGIRTVDKKSPITVVSGENRHVYCRPLISYYLEGMTDIEKMKYRKDSFYSDNNCEVLYGKHAVSVDKDKKTVQLDDGEVLNYDELCVAAGSRSFVPPFEGLDTVEKKFNFMTLNDALALESAVEPDSKVLIVGAGLIGLKCAEGIQERVGSITVCDLADRVLSSILDSECSELMSRNLEEHGISLMLGDTAVRFDKNTAYMKSGSEVDFDVLVLAVGVRANSRPLHGVCNKSGKSGQECPKDRKTDFCPHIRLPAGSCEKYSRCLWLCQDTAKSLQFDQKAADFHEYFPACVHFA